MIAEEEITILSCLVHVNIVKMLDFERSPRFTWIVMEFCDMDLAYYLSQKLVLSEETIRIFFRQVAFALWYLSDLRIIHRDLKPQNLLLSFARLNPSQNLCDLDPNLITIKVADFGLARFVTSSNLAKTNCGTPSYVAPEVKSGNCYNAKADLWSIGVIMFECLTSNLPVIVMGSNNKFIAPHIPPQTSNILRNLLIWLLQTDPINRISVEGFCKHLFFLPQAQPLPNLCPIL